MWYGYPRATQVTDLLVAKPDRARWEQVMSDLGYKVFHDGGAFLQFTPASGVGWELDLMFVAQPTFDQMLADSKPVKIEGRAVRVPSLDHLFALKIHALKHGSGLQVVKDMNDIVEMAGANQVDARSERFRRLFEKYGDLNLYERVVKACAR